MSARCPICGKPAETPRTRPFCSSRCADIDLGRWFNGSYAIPGPPPELEEDELRAFPDQVGSPGRE